MSTFLLLPPKSVCAMSFAEFWRTWFPGTAVPPPEEFAALAERPPNCLVVFADDLAGDVEADLRDAYGAEPGDRVIDLRDGTDQLGGGVASWRVRPAPPGPRDARMVA